MRISWSLILAIIISLMLGLAVTMVLLLPPQVVVPQDSAILHNQAADDSLDVDIRMTSESRSFVAGFGWGIGLATLFLWPEGRRRLR